MRSSIACARCRRSKIKCINSGTDTTCRACASTGRECTYPPPALGSNATPKRTEASGGLRTDGDGDAKRAKKRESDAARKHGIRDGADPLESPPIPPKLWKDIYDLFMLHCSTELPFLHESTFFTKVLAQPAATRSPDTRLLLLGMLTLTARFVPDLVSYHDSHDPLAASEYYADAFASRLDGSVFLGNFSLERVQAFLMVCFYHWGMWRGLRSWMFLTNARGMAQSLGLMFEENPDPNHPSATPSVEPARSSGPGATAKSRSEDNSQVFINREIKRRTAYSLFILDRYLASGKHRPQMFSIDDLHVQLPCSEEDFRFGLGVKTGHLKPPTESSDGDAMEVSDRTEVDKSQVLSMYIRLVEIWGRLARWSCKGGRREENYPPWDSRTEFWKLRQQLEAFHLSLPAKLTYSPTNVAAHIGTKALPLYTSINTLYLLCEIVLHREYVPYAPVSLDRPSGPVDEPTFPKDRYRIPEGFWEESAERIFKAAREIMEIVKATADRDVLVQSPQVAFSVYTAAFSGVYSNNFPHMDVGCHMCDRPADAKWGNSRESWKGATSLAIRTLREMSPKVKMAGYWRKNIDEKHRRYQRIVRDHQNNVLTPPNRSSGFERRSSNSFGDPSPRESYGGGLEEYKLLEKELKDFGPGLDEDRLSTPGFSETQDRPYSRASTAASHRMPYVKMEHTSGVEQTSATATTVRNGNDTSSWAAVNNNTMEDRPSHPPMAGPYNGSYGSMSENPQQGPGYYPRGLTSQPPHLVSPPNARTPVDIHGHPYNSAPPDLTSPSTDAYRTGGASTPFATPHSQTLTTPPDASMAIYSKPSNADVWLPGHPVADLDAPPHLRGHLNGGYAEPTYIPAFDVASFGSGMPMEELWTAGDMSLQLPMAEYMHPASGPGAPLYGPHVSAGAMGGFPADVAMASTPPGGGWAATTSGSYGI